MLGGVQRHSQNFSRDFTLKRQGKLLMWEKHLDGSMPAVHVSVSLWLGCVDDKKREVTVKMNTFFGK